VSERETGSDDSQHGKILQNLLTGSSDRGESAHITIDPINASANQHSNTSALRFLNRLYKNLGESSFVLMHREEPGLESRLCIARGSMPSGSRWR
jgi:hypothetical protein